MIANPLDRQEEAGSMPFVPIEIDAYVALHLQSNPDEDRKTLKARLREALAARQGLRQSHPG